MGPHLNTSSIRALLLPTLLEISTLLIKYPNQIHSFHSLEHTSPQKPARPQAHHQQSVSMQLSSTFTLFVAILAPVAVFAAPAEQQKRYPLSLLPSDVSFNGPYPTGLPPFSGTLPSGTGFPFPSGTGFPHHSHHGPKPTGTFTKHPKITLSPLN